MPKKPTYNDLLQRVRELERAEFERTLPEKSLRESEEKYRLLYEHAPLAYQSLDKNGNIIEVNKAWLDILGYGREEVIGKNFSSFLQHEWVQHFQQNFPRFKAVGEVLGVEFEMVKKDGSMIFVTFNGKVGTDHDGGFLRTHCILNDISQRKRAEEALEAERQTLKIYFENLPLLAYNISLDGKITDCNEVVVQTLGYDSKNDLLGQSLISKVYAPGSRKKAAHLLQSWQAGKTIKNEELQIVTREGRAIDVLLNVNTIFNAQTSPAYSLSTHLDISDWKRAERALEKSERKYRTMMESIVDPLSICSQDFKIEYANPAMINRLERNPVGERCHVALHGSDRKCDWCQYDRVKREHTVEYTVTSPLDNRTYRIQNMPIHNEDGSLSNLNIYRDITDYLHAVAEKERAQLHLLQAQKMEAVGNLAGGVAHDFNNILSSIIGFSELALEDADKKTILAGNIEQVITAGQRAKNLVKQILAYARQSNEELKPIRIDVIAKEVLMFIRSSIPSSIALKPDIQSRSSILGDPTQVHQIFMNLCTNAAQSMESDGGVMSVAIKNIAIYKSTRMSHVGLLPGDYILITVKDTGKGIDPRDLDSIFEPYFSTKKVGEGIGMGLAVVHGIVESYGGKIYVDSRLGKGSTFSIYLPVTKKQKPVDPQIPTTILTGSERILFVDDEAAITKYSYQALRKLGYQMTTRTSSVEALSLFKKKSNDFDLVVTDMTMPNMTGDDLAREILKIRPEIPIIICTGYSSKLTEDDAVSIGIKAVAYKPLGKTDLARIIRTVLD